MNFKILLGLAILSSTSMAAGSMGIDGKYEEGITAKSKLKAIHALADRQEMKPCDAASYITKVQEIEPYVEDKALVRTTLTSIAHALALKEEYKAAAVAYYIALDVDQKLPKDERVVKGVINDLMDEYKATNLEKALEARIASLKAEKDKMSKPNLKLKVTGLAESKSSSPIKGSPTKRWFYLGN